MNYDDVGDAIREGRALREASAYRIRFALEGLTFRNIDVPDPVPTGRQILASAGLDHRADYILFAYLDTGDFEDVRLGETFDLRGKGADAPAERVAWLQAEIRRLKAQRRSLKVSDHEEIAEIRRVYGALLKGSRGVW